MLQIKEISKIYKTGDLVQTALNELSLNLRDNEFVAILGPSGSGKTTLLNVIGGLDRYDSGDLIINQISTKKYKDRDWDSYRNHTIGFVFQNYNLISHQSILANVELALTISGIGRFERKRRAKEALQKVGLGDQIHKRPNQLSGGQMQRVAIARALVNNPDILLADEPTGALDTETSIQVMELLKEVAKDRLVVMVTHNPELAETYATRIVRLRDGKITDDSAPLEIDESMQEVAKHKNMGKASMSFFTSLALSFNNLRTKKARTILTSFAGSIGIIGIALILSLSNGVNTYISDIQKSSMNAYPISIDSVTFEMDSMFGFVIHDDNTSTEHELDAVYSNSERIEAASEMSSNLKENNLTAFKKYLENPASEINKYIGENGVVYSYDTKFDVFAFDSEGTLVNTDGSTLENPKSTSNVEGMPSMGGMLYNNSFSFDELIPGTNGKLISPAITDSYDLLYGAWPASYDEVVLVLDKNNEIPTETLYRLGILPTAEYQDLLQKLSDGEEINLDTKSWNYTDICKHIFYMVPVCDTYVKNSNGLYSSIENNDFELKTLAEKALKLKISGIIRLKDSSDSSFINTPLGYTKALTDYIIEYTDKSDVVLAQKASPDKNILNDMSFSPESSLEKAGDTRSYLLNLGLSDKAELLKEIATSYSDASGRLDELFALSELELAQTFDVYVEKMNDEFLIMFYDTYISVGSYEDNMSTFGVVNLDAPLSINIYSDTFEDKEAIAQCIKDYNDTVEEKDKISYTDYVAILMSSVTTIVNAISYVLIAFVAISLIVSSIMIGIITYISVLERTKEIGILRAVGASKRNISQVFNAETFIVGLFSGLMGIGISLLFIVPINAIIHSVAKTTSVSAALPVSGAITLIIISILLTLIGGIIPSKKAAKKDPVTALRSE